ncbi:MAG: hypothetical protein PF689_04410 [Deltaproteobacteria bacterium]|jgi:hypothetical protein|nr:hypothetical protein [Deltaproteobacteria bacterium]
MKNITIAFLTLFIVLTGCKKKEEEAASDTKKTVKKTDKKKVDKKKVDKKKDDKKTEVKKSSAVKTLSFELSKEFPASFLSKDLVALHVNFDKGLDSKLGKYFLKKHKTKLVKSIEKEEGFLKFKKCVGADQVEPERMIKSICYFQSILKEKNKLAIIKTGFDVTKSLQCATELGKKEAKKSKFMGKESLIIDDDDNTQLVVLDKDTVLIVSGDEFKKTVTSDKDLMDKIKKLHKISPDSIVKVFGRNLEIKDMKKAAAMLGEIKTVDFDFFINMDDKININTSVDVHNPKSATQLVNMANIFLNSPAISKKLESAKVDPELLKMLKFKNKESIIGFQMNIPNKKATELINKMEDGEFNFDFNFGSKKEKIVTKTKKVDKATKAGVAKKVKKTKKSK